MALLGLERLVRRWAAANGELAERVGLASYAEDDDGGKRSKLSKAKFVITKRKNAG